jgi:hypothetical protein
LEYNKIMKNKNLVFILLGIIVILAILAGVYFLIQNKSDVGPTENTVQEKQNNTLPNLPLENKEGSGSEAKMDIPTDNQQPQNKIITNDFSINLPAGWQQSAPAMGTSAMAVNTNEQINDPAAQRINFKSYFAVSYDVFQGENLDDYIQIVKNQLLQAIPSTTFTKEQDMTINISSARAIEAELTQQGVNFKILIIAIAGQGEDVWVISFNTAKSAWPEYEAIFYSIADSFSFEK